MPTKPTKPTEAAPETNGENQGSSIDPQKKYLMDQFGNLMEKVGDGFGGPLQEELINRLEQTIADFHEEVNEMLGRLKDNSEKRHEKLKEIWNNPDVVVDDMLLIDRSYELYLMGMELDYNYDDFESAFTFKNPKATSSCGCGTSFSI